MDAPELRRQVQSACRHLLSEQNRDPYTPTYGCFDRRYWGWKLIDYPEATFQRNVYPLAWLSRQADTAQPGMSEVLTGAVKAGLEFSTQIQHPDGSFDQAFPHEHSFGATAFLLHSLLKAYQLVRDACSPTFQKLVEDSLQRAADFLCRHDETHGHIANHVAGAVLSLLVSADFFQEPRFERRAIELLDRILAHQSPEGWFLEYEGADPGYQTLCLYYLAQVYRFRPDARLRDGLDEAIVFLSWFVHPDGTFGGEYGSRRTAVYYPGGLAMLSREFPMAWSITHFMLKAIGEGRTVTLGDVDMGNVAPLLSNYVAVLDADVPDPVRPLAPLPCEQENVSRDLIRAGLHVRGTRRYYAIVGASNGGVLKVFDREKRALIWNDAGYVGQDNRGTFITTQVTDINRSYAVEPGEVVVQAPFYRMLRSVPTPLQFVLLRLLNLTVMRSARCGNWIKNVLVRLLISGKKSAPLCLTRTVKFEPDRMVITDVLCTVGRVTLRWLESGRPFVAVHMASARYFQGFSSEMGSGSLGAADVATLNTTGELYRQVIV